MRLVVLALLLVGCGPHGNSGGPDMAPRCPSDLPQQCPTPMPTWDGGVLAIINGKCTVCHRAGGLSASWPMTNYAEVSKLKQGVIDQVYSCFMPPPDAGQLDESQRQALLGWIVCGALEN
jgi:hypothetical protein